MASIYHHIPSIKNDVFLTVIITFYNQEDFVNKCLSSVLNQKTKYSFEIIVIDDGSTDTTIEKIKSWKHLYPSKVSLELMSKNLLYRDQISRVSRCRLKGLSMASGKYLCFLDGDDFFPDLFKLEKQISILEDNPKCCACLSNYTSSFNGGETIIRAAPLPSIFNVKKYMIDYYLHASTMVYRNTTFVCYDDDFDDNSISFSFFNSRYLYFLNEVTFCHFKTKDSSWLNKSDDEKTAAIIKGIDDAISCSNISYMLIYLRYRQFIIKLYYDRKSNLKSHIEYLRPLQSKILKWIINYEDTIFIDRILLKCFITNLCIYSKIHNWLLRRAR